nr:hypothetical protein [Tanacetum cinerariifolium]
HGAFLTQGKASSIPTVFSWSGSISPKGFMPSILLLASFFLMFPEIGSSTLLDKVIVAWSNLKGQQYEKLYVQGLTAKTTWNIVFVDLRRIMKSEKDTMISLESFNIGNNTSALV